jgi:hypothetical protein
MCSCHETNKTGGSRAASGKENGFIVGSVADVGPYKTVLKARRAATAMRASRTRAAGRFTGDRAVKSALKPKNSAGDIGSDADQNRHLKNTVQPAIGSMHLPESHAQPLTQDSRPISSIESGTAGPQPAELSNDFGPGFNPPAQKKSRTAQKTHTAGPQPVDQKKSRTAQHVASSGTARLPRLDTLLLRQKDLEQTTDILVSIGSQIESIFSPIFTVKSIRGKKVSTESIITQFKERNNPLRHGVVKVLKAISELLEKKSFQDGVTLKSFLPGLRRTNIQYDQNGDLSDFIGGGLHAGNFLKGMFNRTKLRKTEANKAIEEAEEIKKQWDAFKKDKRILDLFDAVISLQEKYDAESALQLIIMSRENKDTLLQLTRDGGKVRIFFAGKTHDYTEFMHDITHVWRILIELIVFDKKFSADMQSILEVLIAVLNKEPEKNVGWKPSARVMRLYRLFKEIDELVFWKALSMFVPFIIAAQALPPLGIALSVIVGVSGSLMMICKYIDHRNRKDLEKESDEMKHCRELLDGEATEKNKKNALDTVIDGIDTAFRRFAL